MSRLTNESVHGTDRTDCIYSRASFSGCTAFWNQDNWDNACQNQQHRLRQQILNTEDSHFRTIHDTGASNGTLLVWNTIRRFAGLSNLTWEDLAAYCKKCHGYHVNPCERELSKHDSKEYRSHFGFPIEDLCLTKQ